MIKQTIEKIGKLLKERTYSVPQILFKFYTFFTYYAYRIQREGAQFNDITLFSDVFKLYKTYLVDQPFQMTKLIIVKLDEEFKEHNRDTIAQFVRLKDRVMKQFPNFKPKEKHFHQMLAQVSNLAWVTKLRSVYSQSQQIKKQVESKKKNQHVKHSELTITCWYRQFKGDYFVHVDIFIQYIGKFIKQYFPMLSFINKYSCTYLKQLCDPERKCLVTIMNCEDLFYKLRDPNIIDKLWQQSQQVQKQQHTEVQIQNFLQMSLQLVSNKTSEKIEGSRNKVKIDSNLKDLQKQSIIFIGSAADNDIVIKSKYISRKQLMIVQQRRGQKQQKTKSKQVDSLNFSIVCLSQTNFTAVKFPRPLKLHVGDIFFCQKTQYQVLKIQKQSFQIHEMEQDEQTLSILPVDRQSIQSFKNSQKIIFLILSGEDKEKQFAISSQNMPAYLTSDEKHQRIISNELIHNDSFLLKPGVKILLKNANQILQNRLSKKVRLVKGLQICLEQYSLIIQ